MSDFELIHRPAISTKPVGSSDAFAMKAMPEGTLIHILGKPGAENLTATLQGLFGGEANRIRTFGPGQWLVVRDEPTSRSDMQALFERLDTRAFAVDQTHGRIRIEVAGRAVQSLLAKGTAIDLNAVAVGQSAMTLMGHISVHITRVALNRFELIVLRGFGQSLWDEIAHLNADF
ncbi:MULTISPECIES: sarcosine oxidase subunit gamma family protein [Mesorhizobium]|uniref:Sarcosine oxidase subunit gamma family protein n=4 Tax=Mesorhizobium TaxID=68287 RepID=A0ABZ0VHK2_9HYPH|nr:MULTISPECIES: sarcosine oxidase subunit gamma family protein [Mesorhizobium]MBZ9909387.1 sarcosine oxidase subunit gamma [Mesorhizobium sp. BR115XR7A]QGX80647.1 sarcosine oxidase subunit gamma [Mesorhizobium japonicum R7A]QJF04790.1 sarcosine oxidase subunit gamma [Mesorhizobium japonicum R7A]QJF10859.1 sarcosine oxidase subunit gamma [Mesorhizobium japonicum]QJI86732.1 sarcosine oxidase subunit gamma [Mesorhizobium japonicum]